MVVCVGYSRVVWSLSSPIGVSVCHSMEAATGLAGTTCWVRERSSVGTGQCAGAEQWWCRHGRDLATVSHTALTASCYTDNMLIRQC